jgi:transcription initiation factor IIE alpha subunit
MTLKPLEELDWVQARLAAGESEVAYTCPEHPHVFSDQGGQCPRCGRELEPFKVMYTCPDAEHGNVISAHVDTCPHCNRGLTPFRGIWLSPEMADENAPPNPEVAERAAYHCPVHPLVHSDQPGKCPICARDLDMGEIAGTEGPRGLKPAARPPIPADAQYVCPMEECWHFAAGPGECPKCGMNIKPIEEVEWAKALREAEGRTTARPQYVCPMHPDQVSADQRGTCPICGMQLVAVEAVPQPTSAPAAIATQMNYLMEHYLELQKRFASDRTSDVALHALGLAGAADTVLAQLDDLSVNLPGEFGDSVRKLRAGALKTTGRNIEADRVTFVEVGAAMRTLVEHVRPDKERYPKIYIFHCPMTKGDWLQTSEEMANPFYGFKMLKCGELQVTK